MHHLPHLVQSVLIILDPGYVRTSHMYVRYATPRVCGFVLNQMR